MARSLIPESPELTYTRAQFELPSLASSLLHKAAQRGLVSRIKRGVFVLVPGEMGSSAEYSGNREDRQGDTNSYTFYLRYTGPFPAGNVVKVDIAVRERLVFPMEERAILRGYREFTMSPKTD